MIDNNTCPFCPSTNVEDTNECVMTPDEITQGYRCIDCGTEWDAKFVPIKRTVTKKSEKHFIIVEHPKELYAILRM